MPWHYGQGNMKKDGNRNWVDFPKGLVSLPAADAKSNGVSSNYFVMVKKK
jgi:hypothetical protein